MKQKSQTTVMHEHVLLEKDRVGRVSQIRELVFGAQDGLLVPLGVISSVAGAFANNHIVLVAGISEALAGAFSMGTGAFLASQAERQVHIAEIEKERLEYKRNPLREQAEVVALFEHDGLSKEDAQLVVKTLAKSERAFFHTMIQKELGIEPEPPGTPTKDAVMVGLSYVVAAMVPLAPYFWLSGTRAIVASIGATFVALFAIGVAKGKVAALPYLKSGLQVMLVGAGAGIGGYFLGTWLPKLLKLE